MRVRPNKVSGEDREIVFANIKKAAKNYGIDMTKTDWTQSGQAGRRRTAEGLHARPQPHVRGASASSTENDAVVSGDGGGKDERI